MRFTTVFFLFASFTLHAATLQPLLINGTPVDKGSEFDAVVNIEMKGGLCTATIVGPRVILTAAHCGGKGAKATFTYQGKKYTATLEPSRFYASKDHDISVGILAKPIPDVKPFSIGGKAVEGEKLTLMGYGCIKTDGTGGNDGVLRRGETVITGFMGNYDIMSEDAAGAVLCFGDSGGPAFTETPEGLRVLGVNSKGNIVDLNLNSRMDHEDTTKFFGRIIKEKRVDICGISVDC